MTISPPVSKPPYDGPQADTLGTPWAPQRQRRAQRRRRRLGMAAAASVVAIAALLVWNRVGTSDRPAPNVAESADLQRRSEPESPGPRLPESTENTDESRFDSGVPDGIDTLPAPLPGTPQAFATESHQFVTAVHAAANSSISGVELPTELKVDQAQQLRTQLAALDAQALDKSELTQLATANWLYEPVIALLAAETTPPELADQLRSASNEWSEVLAAVSPDSQLQIPPVATPVQPAPTP